MLKSPRLTKQKQFTCFFWVEGFEVQMKGPELEDGKRKSDQYRTILQKPGSARSADIFPLEPKSTYKFRVIPTARTTAGEPTEVHRIGPGGLQGWDGWTLHEETYGGRILKNEKNDLIIECRR